MPEAFDLMRYLRYDAKHHRMVFTGKKLVMEINERWRNYGGMAVMDGVAMAMAVGDITVNDKDETGLLVAGVAKFYPSETEMIKTAEEDAVLQLTFREGDVFMDTLVVKNAKLTSAMFYELLYLANVPRFLKYHNLFKLMDVVCDVTGVSFPLDHAIFEILYAHTNRIEGDINTPYRLGGAGAKPLQSSLRDVAHVATSTTARIVGSMFNEGVDAAMVHPADQPSHLENILRK